MSDKLLTITDSMGSYLVKVVMEEIKQQRLMWAVTPSQQQQETIDRVADHIDTAVKQGVRRILSAGLPSVVATLEQVTIKDGTKAVLLFGTEELHAVTDIVGSKVVLVLADPEVFAQGTHSYSADADQQTLEL